MKNKIKNKLSFIHLSQRSLITLSVLGTILVLSGTSYAYWALNRTQNSFNKAATDCFEMILKENTDAISLTSAMPTSDTEGLKGQGYSFTIKNTCTSLVGYEVNLEDIFSATNTKRLSNQYIKVSLNNSTPKLLKEYVSAVPTIETADSSFKLTSGSLGPDEEATYELKLWMDKDTPSKDETMNAKFESKISIIGNYIQDTDKENEITLNISSKSNGFSKEKETFLITAQSTNKNLIEYSLNGSTWTSFSPTTSISFEKDITTEGTYTLYMKDEVGNIKTINFTTDKLDQTAPTINIISNQNSILKATITDEKSGLSGYQITSSLNEPNEYKNVSGDTFDLEEKLTADGTYYLWVKDSAGNISHQEITVLAKDGEAPKISYNVTPESCTSDDWCQDATFNATVKDDTGVAEVKYCLTTDNSCTPDTLATLSNNTFTVASISSSKAQKLCAMATDTVLNKSDVICSGAYKVDKNKPTVDFNYKISGTSLLISALNSYDEESGIKSYTFSNDGGNTFTEASLTATYQWDNLEYKSYDIVVKVLDNVSNESTYKTTITINKSLEDSVKEAASNSNNCPVVSEDGTISNISSTTSAMVCQAPDDYGTSYYYRGSVTNNYVKFGGYYWRILRINGDSSVRLIYAGDASVIDKLDSDTRKKVLTNGYNDYSTNYLSIGGSYYNRYWKKGSEDIKYANGYDYVSLTNDNAIVGYMYGDQNGIYEGSEIVGSETFDYEWMDYGNPMQNPEYVLYANYYTLENNYFYIDKIGYGSALDFISDSYDLIGNYYYSSSSNISDKKVKVYVMKKVRKADEAQSDGNRQYRNYYYGVTTYGTTSAALAQKNTNNSELKITLDNWYKKNLSAYSNYLADSLYCNNRSVGTGSHFLGNYSGDAMSNLRYGASGTYYHGSDSNYTLKCPQQNDRFTVSDSINGNAALTYSIGTITSDEVMLAGLDKTGYLDNSISYWTMTPHAYYYYGIGSNSAFYVNYVSKGYSSSSVEVNTDRWFSDSSIGVRPVINLKNDVLTLGDGTIDNPYRADSELVISSSEFGNNSWYKSLTLEYIPGTLVDKTTYCVTTDETCTPDTEVKLTMGTFKYTFKGNEKAERLCINDGEKVICSNAYLVDPVKPVANINAEVTDTGVTVDLSSSTDKDSKIVKYYFSRDGNTFTTSTSPTYSYTISENGVYKIYAKVEDNAGNISDISEKDVTVFRPFSVVSSTSGKNNWYTALKMQVFTLEDTDKMNYCVTTDETCTPDREATLTDKSFFYDFESASKAQKICINYNNEIKCSVSYFVDTTKPEAKISVTSDKSNITVSADGSFDDESGIAKYYFSKDGKSYTSYTSYNSTNYSIYQNGTFTFYVKVENKAGLISDVAKVNAKVDLTEKANEFTSSGSYVYAGDTYTTDIYRGNSDDIYTSSTACSNDKVSNCHKVHSKGDKVLWQIVGVENVDNGTGTTEQRLKLITSENIGYYSWVASKKSSSSDGTYGTSDLMKLLNPGYESESVNNSLYYNSKSGSCYYDGYSSSASCDFTNIGLRSMKNYISDAVWNTGLISSNDINESDYNSHEKSSTWIGKVGLISSLNYRNSVSEYEHSRYYGEEDKLCYDLSITTWDFYYCDSSCMMGGGVYTNGCKTESWLANKYGYNDSDSFTDYIGRTVLLNYHDDYPNFENVRPSVYVSESAYILEGDGSESNPYVLGYPKTPEEQIISSVDTTSSCPVVSSDGKVDVSKTEEEKALVCQAPDDYGTSYYFRGNVVDNWVKYAGAYWKILRINGDKSIRMIYSGTESAIDGLSADKKQQLITNNIENPYAGSFRDYLSIGKSSFSKEWRNGNNKLSTSSTTHFDNVGLSYMYGNINRVETERTDEDTYTIWYHEKAFRYSDSYTYDASTDRYQLSGNVKTVSFEEIDVDDLAGKYFLNDLHNCDKYGNPTSCQYVSKMTTASHNQTKDSDPKPIIYVKYHAIGYASTSKDEIQQNINDSDVKEAVDKWYASFLETYSNDISDTLFCNDRSTISGDGYGLETTEYRAEELFLNKKVASLKCVDQKDRFTVDSSFGNQGLTYAVGLVTADELFLAGGYGNFGYIPHHYLATDFYYQSMTPVSAGWLSSIVEINSVSINYTNSDSISYIRPVINLKQGILKVGNGTFENPYRIS